MTIPVWSYLKEYENEQSDLLAAVEQVMSSGWLILGQSVKNFEEQFAAFCGCRHGIGVASGTDAIFLALKALGVKSGDEVITVSNTAVPTVSAIVSVGAVPKFVDIDPATFLMDAGKLESAITPRTACILPVHLYGQCANMDAINSVAEKHGLKVLEDCAQCHGAEYKGRRAGSMSGAAAFSFYPTKVLGAYGDGGIVTTSDDQVEQKMRRLRFYGMEEGYYAEEHGYCSRLDEMQAEILFRKLGRIENYISRRREIAARYDRELAATSLTLPKVAEGNTHVYYLYVVRHPERERIIAGLKERGIAASISYPWPIHLMRGYSNLGYAEGDFPETETAAREIFSLPMFPTLEDSEQEKVIAALRDLV